MDTTISPEYQQILKDEHEEAVWGTTGARNAGHLILPQLERMQAWLPEVTLLDVGCGTGTLVEHLRGRLSVSGLRQVHFYEYDPGVKGRDDPDILMSKVYNMVTTTDVLEHVEPAYLDNLIRAMSNACTHRQCHYIACSPDGHRLPDGRDRHLTVEPPIWWCDKLDRVTGSTFQVIEYHHIERLQRGEMRPAAFIVLDRVKTGRL